MTKVRLVLMFRGRVEYDIETEMVRPLLKETITLSKSMEHYKINFIQHFFNEHGEFQYLMITGIKD